MFGKWKITKNIHCQDTENVFNAMRMMVLRFQANARVHQNFETLLARARWTKMLLNFNVIILFFISARISHNLTIWLFYTPSWNVQPLCWTYKQFFLHRFAKQKFVVPNLMTSAQSVCVSNKLKSEIYYGLIQCNISTRHVVQIQIEIK